MDFFDNLNWRLTKFLLSCFGAWPFQPLWVRRIIKSVALILIMSLFLPEILRLLTVRKDKNLIVECAPIFALHLLTITKMLHCLFNSKQIKNLLKNVQKDYQSDLSYCETNILQSYSQKNRRMTYIYVYFIYTVTAMYMFTPLIPKILDQIVPLNESRPKIALYQTEYFVDSEKYEILILLHAYIITPFPTTVIVAFDILYANFVHHGCSMFVIVGCRLKNTVHYEEQRPQDNLTIDYNNNAYSLLAKCIKQHTEVLKLVIAE